MTASSASRDPHRRRLERVRARARGLRIDHLLFTPGEDLLYLTGERLESHERLTALVVPVGDEEVEPTLLLPVLESTDRSRAAAERIGARVLTWTDADDPLAALTGLLDRSGRIGVSSACPASHLVPLVDRVDASVVLAGPVIDRVREIKSVEELWQLAEAARRIDSVHARMERFLRPGRTEREVATDIAEAIVETGLVRAEFVIVGSGPNGVDPHHALSDRIVVGGDVVVVDIGGPMPSGYHSDCTRTYAVGTPDPLVVETYEVLREAQRLARAAVRPGVPIGEVDAAARDHLARAGLGDYFTHRTGHGIGIGLHEPPFAAPGAEEILREGMTFSVEPGIYLPGRWGARLEDIVAVTAEGCTPLNDRPRELTVLPG